MRTMGWLVLFALAGCATSRTEERLAELARYKAQRVASSGEAQAGDSLAADAGH